MKKFITRLHQYFLFSNFQIFFYRLKHYYKLQLGQLKYYQNLILCLKTLY